MDQADELRKKVKLLKENAPSTRVIAVTSGKGGVGKTSISVNLALQLRQLGKSVVILDADFGLANVEVMLGIRPRYNLADLIFNNRSIEEIITEGPMGIGFISGGSGVQDLVNLDMENLKTLIAKLVKLDSMYDVVIIDTGAGIADSVIEFVLSSPEVLLIVTPEPTSITDAYSLLKAVNRKKGFDRKQKSIKVITNRVNNMEEGKEIYEKISLVVSKFLNIQLEYLGYIPMDKQISNAVIEQKPISISSPNSEPAVRIKSICSKLLDIPFQEEEKIGFAKVLLDFIKSKKNG
ncbi:MAG: MinD/ParA family protein [Bacteroidales bacterium]|nr:MinD/ParA family protein [Clostridium sp.]MCM1202744.1 MinD/ParA family protein [Bacteroidales bacterium]